MIMFYHYVVGARYWSIKYVAFCILYVPYFILKSINYVFKWRLLVFIHNFGHKIL